MVEEHFCLELFQDTILDIIPGQVTINPTLLFFEVLVSFLKIFRQARGHQQRLALLLVECSRLFEYPVLKEDPGQR